MITELTNERPKQTFYKTAYSPLFNVFVEITAAWTDQDNKWIFQCNSNYTKTRLNNCMFREHELNKYCL